MKTYPTTRKEINKKETVISMAFKRLDLLIIYTKQTERQKNEMKCPSDLLSLFHIQSDK